MLDRWILSELDDTIAVVTDALEGFDALGGANRIGKFIDDLSNWYVRRSRPRFWKASDANAHATLHECLVTVAQLLAPFCPFLADEIHTTLTGARSVHLTDWPEPQGRHDPALAEQMAAARRLVGLGRAARTDAKMKVRQPLSRALLLHTGADLDPDVDAEIRSELNVKTLERLDTLSGLMRWNVVPNFRTLGPRLGPQGQRGQGRPRRRRRLRAPGRPRARRPHRGRRREAHRRRRRRAGRAPRRPRPGGGRRLGRGPRPRARRRPPGRGHRPRAGAGPQRRPQGRRPRDRRPRRRHPRRRRRPAGRGRAPTGAYIAAEVLATEIAFGPGDRTLELDGTTVAVALTKACDVRCG